MQNKKAFSKVSIIMAAYNRAGYIAETIESVQKQTYQNWELIIVDDGSDDNTKQVVEQINDARIQFIEAGRIGVGGKIKNIGIEKASGEFIAFIDSDDLWERTKIEKQVTVLRNYQQAGFSLTGGYNFKKAFEPVDYFYKQRDGIKYADVFLSFFRSELPGYAQALLMRKHCLDVAGTFKETGSFSDADFILKLACHFKAVILYEPLVFRRLHDTNYTNSNWEKSYDEGIGIIQFYKTKKLITSKIYRNALFRVYLNFGETCLTHNDQRKAIFNFFKSWKNKPYSSIPLRKTGKAIIFYLKNKNLYWVKKMKPRFINMLMTKRSSTKENQPEIPAKPWRKNHLPRRVLAIRLQAMGDLVITLPYLQQFKKALPPDCKVHLLTRQEVEAIPKNIQLFDRVYSIGGGRNGKKQLLHSFWLLPKLLMQQYDIVIDLQNNSLSQLIRKIIMPKAWSVFDRFSAVPAGECTRLTIEAIGLGKCFADTQFKFKSEIESIYLLKKNGWDGISELVVLNPAGAFETRNWPMEYYIGFAKLWLNHFPRTQFLVMGVAFISAKVNFLKNNLEHKLIDLVTKTTPVQAFAILQKIKIMLSEDSGLMHMAWVSGIPTLAMFGSTRSDRATPLGTHTLLLNSSDLACGNCMLEKCIYGDNRCLTRYTPQFVFEKALTLIH